MGSLRNNCFNPGGDESCMPGCPPRDLWCDQRGAFADQKDCDWVGDPSGLWRCCYALPPEDWKGLLRMQDAHMAFGPCPRQLKDVDCDDGTARETWKFDEIIIDRVRLPWDDELHAIIEAVVVAPTASEVSQQYARATHEALLRLLNVSDAQLPLLTYDASLGAEPFGSVTPSSFGCQPWCASHPALWHLKCSFSGCSGCQDCAPGGANEIDGAGGQIDA